MALWNWDPFREMEALHREMDRAFHGYGRGLPFSRVAFLPGRAARMYPMINLTEDKDAFRVEALAPVVDSDSINVTVAHNQLTISGEKKPLGGDIKPDQFHRSERATGRFVRSIDLPAEVDSDKVTADYKDGILLIRLPKTEAAKPKQINVSVG